MANTPNNNPEGRVLADKTAVVVHRSFTMAEDVAYIREQYSEGTYVFVPLEFGTYTYLVDRGLPVLDLGPYHKQHDRSAYMAPIYKIATEWYGEEVMQTFIYKGTALGSVYEWPLTLYLWRVLYYFNLFSYVFTQHGTPRAVVLMGGGEVVPDTAGPLASEEVRVIERTLAELMPAGTVRVVSRNSVVASTISQPIVWVRILLATVLRYVTVIMARRAGNRTIRIFMSEYWHNVSAFLPSLTNAEIISMDRKDAQKLLPYIWKLRIQFDRPAHFICAEDREELQVLLKRYQTLWRDFQKSRQKRDLYIVNGQDVFRLIEPALKKIVCHAAIRYVEERIGVERLIKAYRINRVIVRASVSTQHHFLAIADAAKEADVPCIELQHGLEYWGPNSLSTRKHTEAIATYGPLVSEYLNQVRSIPIGSPRFDTYREHQGSTAPMSTRSRIVVLIPEIGIENFTSYDVAAFLDATIQAATADTRNTWVFRFRPGMLSRPEYAQLAEGMLAGFEIQDEQSLSDVLQDTRILIAHFSTAVLEAMQCRVPVVVWTGHGIDAVMLTWQFASLWEQGGIGYAPGAAELAAYVNQTDQALEAQISVADTWLSEKFLFDGKSSKRMSDLLYTGW